MWCRFRANCKHCFRSKNVRRVTRLQLLTNVDSSHFISESKQELINEQHNFLWFEHQQLPAKRRIFLWTQMQTETNENLNDFSVELIREREMCECENSTDCTDLNNLIISVFSLHRVRETTAQCCRGSRHYWRSWYWWSIGYQSG